MKDDTILSVGIDLGTSTTQLVLSRLTIKNFASAFSVPRINISKKEVIYKSDIIFTPLLDQQTIDAEAIKHFVAAQYSKAGIDKQKIQMGAVIITGETARKDNANLVTEALSGYAGDFVVATAGPDLESIIAGKGAGTNIASKKSRHYAANVDVGGGTSNLVVFDGDDVLDTACFDIGGRLIKVDKKTHKITYISPKVTQLITQLGLSLAEGSQASPETLAPIIQVLVQVLENSIGIGERSPYYDMFITNHGLRLDYVIPALTFSGGVADCLQENLPVDIFKYGDIGLLLGNAIRRSEIFKQKEVIHSLETIRATVVGAGSHTTDVSGSTISYTNGILPIRNLPILKMARQDEAQDVQPLAASIKEKINWYRVQNELSNVALAFNGLGNPHFSDIQRYAAGIVAGAAVLIEKHEPLIILVHEDMAKALGHSLFAQLPEHYPFVCIDSVKVENGDYIDLGEPIAEGSVLPVIVKTLIFG
ncbi:ethanolamine ammonia-lyase reactivating factor EutA [Loigolactobacillus coryniformis]|jgi:ethanolamine utilization protein EutA|uniref:Ethanolamine ammonia-lyase reactivating factor EutA n=1 Tax=Loigolactobacillus coryniformis TaxID=1610 RepID=A0A5B8TGZ1_9LACO|nr:ethanolamine ammonia-lyase reactivating factor EutA [Loigolactobacillus coryniformis]MBW4803209.1 ethanolamine ammonia-lyase reactivating factor EutA [Loigolactobacillus coryniformis subsp. torquens]MBW4805904.1 ethanolamine ammonia-lyase reactivating factor EutA [Loigolactobacillus coryniformis subsp. torquens]MDC4184956.1 ethanolamine ammonia-lyase reactivating factor EutA [Loigolactobacillus coryniformis]QEA53115.1 ethanolamine ammonia-lyase reactivating factor EutA [Loigolactobacillus co